MNPNHPEGHFNLARLLVRHGDDRNAETHFRKDGFVLDALAAAYAATGNFVDAITTARNAAERAAEQRLDALSADIQRRLAGYELGKSYVE